MGSAPMQVGVLVPDEDRGLTQHRRDRMERVVVAVGTREHDNCEPHVVFPQGDRRQETGDRRNSETLRTLLEAALAHRSILTPDFCLLPSSRIHLHPIAFDDGIGQKAVGHLCDRLVRLVGRVGIHVKLEVFALCRTPLTVS